MRIAVELDEQRGCGGELMGSRSRGWKMEADAVRRILLEDWDPIGGVPDDEYDSYIPGILRLLGESCDAHRLAAHLLRLESNSMGLSGADAERCRRVAVRLLESGSGSR
jgi:hypothetical protein